MWTPFPNCSTQKQFSLHKQCRMNQSDESSRHVVTLPCDRLEKDGKAGLRHMGLALLLHALLASLCRRCSITHLHILCHTPYTWHRLPCSSRCIFDLNMPDQKKRSTSCLRCSLIGIWTGEQVLTVCLLKVYQQTCRFHFVCRAWEGFVFAVRVFLWLCSSGRVLTCHTWMLSPPQVIGFSSETVAAFIAVVGILSILAQVTVTLVCAVEWHVIRYDTISGCVVL